jgi:hypothetical protein
VRERAHLPRPPPRPPAGTASTLVRRRFSHMFSWNFFTGAAVVPANWNRNDSCSTAVVSTALHLARVASSRQTGPVEGVCCSICGVPCLVVLSGSTRACTPHASRRHASCIGLSLMHHASVSLIPHASVCLSCIMHRSVSHASCIGLSVSLIPHASVCLSLSSSPVRSCRVVVRLRRGAATPHARHLRALVETHAHHAQAVPRLPPRLTPAPRRLTQPVSTVHGPQSTHPALHKPPQWSGSAPCGSRCVGRAPSGSARARPLHRRAVAAPTPPPRPRPPPPRPSP